MSSSSGDRASRAAEQSGDRPSGQSPSIKFGIEKRTLRDLAAIALTITVLLLPGIFATELSTTDEARYTQVAREMREADRWLAPLLNDEEYWQKPALFFDLLQIPQRLTGEVSAVQSRLVILPFAIFCLWGTYAIGLILARRRAALLSAGCLGTLALFHEYAHRAVFDVPMLACIIGALYCYVVWTRTDRSPQWWRWLAALLMGIGTHFKGPVAILLPGAVMAIDSITRHRIRAFLSLTGYWIGPVALLVLGAWFLPMAAVYGEKFTEFMLEEHLIGRSVSNQAPHLRPFYYYIPKIIASWVPWIFVAPIAWRLTRSTGLTPAADPRLDPPLRFPFIWAVSIPLILSLIASKRTQYLLPATPGFCLWIGITFDQLLRRGTLQPGLEFDTAKVLRVFMLILAALLVIAVIGPILLQSTVSPDAAISPKDALLLGSIAAFFFVTTASLLRSATPIRLYLALLILGIGANQIHCWGIASLRDKAIRPNEFGQEIREIRELGIEVGLYSMRLNGTYLLHSGSNHFVPINQPKEVPRFLNRPGAQAVIGKRRYLERQIPSLLSDSNFVILAKHREGRAQVLLIGDSVAEALSNKASPNDRSLPSHSPGDSPKD